MPTLSFSIVIDNYNYAQYLPAAIDSCLGQNYPGDLVEIIVVDDGSTDESLAVLQNYADCPNLTVVSKQNGGQASAFAAGVARARGDFICLLDADDFYHSSKLSRVAERIRSYGETPEWFFLCHDCHILEESSQTVLKQDWFDGVLVPKGIECAGLRQINFHSPFAMPLGQVFSRPLLTRVLDTMPLSDWIRAADAPLAHGAALLSGAVHYLHEPLATYRVHGGNTFARIVNGRFQNSITWRSHWPKLLWYMEHLIDSMELDARQRNERLAYLKRMQRIVGITSHTLKFTEPKVSFIVWDAGPSAIRLEKTLYSILQQTHRNWELVVVAGAGDAACQELVGSYQQANPQFSVRCVNPAPALGPLTAGYPFATGDYLVPVAGGDVLDRLFAERHLDVHRHASLCMVTSSDLRLVDDDDKLLHEGCYATSGAWQKWVEYTPPFATPLTGWAFSPRSANMFRRTAMTDLFFSHARQYLTPELANREEGLLLYFAQALGGSTRLNECLSSLRFDAKDDPLCLHLHTPMIRPYPQPVPPLLAGTFFFRLFCAHFPRFKAYYSFPGAIGFLNWLVQHNAPRFRSMIREQADAYRNNPELSALIAKTFNIEA